ncbi:hypothetical protein GGI15_002610 [Coemansia interrupta]|uniref:Transmembrane protein 188 n=1 Tax=Coemansia interrupta TaxID=1126814 RepID=A0A9W8HES4_9FUNG|nr:hypothetical protein GGI15_002610 [Coemansia interrupta]
MSSSPISSLAAERDRSRSLHSSAYQSAAMGSTSDAGTRALAMQGQGMLSPQELASMYTRQFAATKPSGYTSTIYEAAASAAVSTANQTYVHGLSVLQCARSRGPIDQHVYRDWLIFEERLKQSYRRLQRKKRNYLVQIVAFGVLALYFAWFGVFGTKNYRFTCKLLSAGSAYCIYLIVTNRRFLQSIKYPAQCNRSLHQFRMRFEASPVHASSSPMLSNSDSAVADDPTTTRGSASARVPAALEKTPTFLTESQMTFFPTVPRQLRDGYLEFKTTYYRKRDVAKKRMLERTQRDKRRKSSLSNAASPKSSERKSKGRGQRQHLLHSTSSSHEGDFRGGISSSSSGRIASATLAARTSPLTAVIPRSALATVDGDSATDEGSTTSSSVISRKKRVSDSSSRRGGSSLIYTLAEQDTSSDSDRPI